ncbi:sporulation protein YunB [Alkalihalobacillus sp. AL-G]|uniref:sporulation protein YunB n=1 Tax=Alkalihalobacillus sp. AL-G TaxID=2926399 RepID=UPI00272CD130|nr:sporulation protein YunB [Alkalihalobacillus sp. AL-G]WLD92701.1 sporulation protein YunB [Alkalihalobacillus sp. AL-G]
MWKMRRRPRNGPLPFKYVFVISFVIFAVLTLMALVYINKGIEPIVMSIAETKSKQIASRAINDAISKKIVEDMNVDELFIRHEEGTYSFNPKEYSRIVSEATIRVQKYLDYVEAGKIDQFDTTLNDIEIEYERAGADGIVFDIPLGVATNNVLFENLGPRIPVRFEIIGSVESKIRMTKVEMGINNTLLEVYIDFKVIANVVIPFSQENTVVKNEVFIGNIFIPGDVPYYFGTGDDAQPVIPIDPKKSKENQEDGN